MWFIPLLLIGAIAYAVSKSPRERTPLQRQLSAPASPPLPPPTQTAGTGRPGPIAVLGELLLAGQHPPSQVILCAIAEAEALGLPDLATSIVRTFGMPQVPAISASPRERRSAPRVTTCLPVPPAVATAPAETAAEILSPEAPPRIATAEEALSMLHADPQAFLRMVATGHAPTPVSTPAPTPSPPPTNTPAAAPDSAPVPPLPESWSSEVLLPQLVGIPGYIGAGISLDPNAGEVFEVDWVQGFPGPTLPSHVDGRPVRVVSVERPPSTLSTPGSPIPGIADDAWRTFISRLVRESPSFNSTRHVGQYRQRRGRLAELGIDPAAILGSPEAQRAALDTDLVNAYEHASAGGLVGYVGHGILIPGHEERVPLTLSGLLGVIQSAGLDGASGWLQSLLDRKRYPHTTQAFQRTNGVF